MFFPSEEMYSSRSYSQTHTEQHIVLYYLVRAMSEVNAVMGMESTDLCTAQGKEE